MNKTYVSFTQGSHWFLCLHVFIAFTEGNCFPVLFISVFLTKALVLQLTTHPTYSIIPQHVVVVWGVT